MDHDLRDLLAPADDPRLHAVLLGLADALPVEPDEVTARRHRRRIHQAVASGSLGLGRRLSVATGAAAAAAVVVNLAVGAPAVSLDGQRAVQEASPASELVLEELRLFTPPPEAAARGLDRAQERRGPQAQADRGQADRRQADRPQAPRGRAAGDDRATPPADPAPPRGRAEERPPAGPPATPPRATPTPPGVGEPPRATPTPGGGTANQGGNRATPSPPGGGQPADRGQAGTSNRPDGPPGHDQRSDRADTARDDRGTPPGKGPQR